MPYQLEWELSGVYRRYFGDVTIAERRASFDEICGDPRFDSLRYAITDYLDVIGYETTEQATEEIAALHIAPLMTNPRIVMAAVAIKSEIIDAIRSFQRADFTDAPYCIFSTLDDARKWVEASRSRAN